MCRNWSASTPFPQNQRPNRHRTFNTVTSTVPGNQQAYFLLGACPLGLLLLATLSATAARIRCFNAALSIFSPSWMSMARLTFPSRLELKRPEAWVSSAAPLANVILTTLLYVSPVHTTPLWDHTGTRS